MALYLIGFLVEPDAAARIGGEADMARTFRARLRAALESLGFDPLAEEGPGGVLAYRFTHKAMPCAAILFATGYDDAQDCWQFHIQVAAAALQPGGAHRTDPVTQDMTDLASALGQAVAQWDEPETVQLRISDDVPDAPGFTWRTGSS